MELEWTENLKEIKKYCTFLKIKKKLKEEMNKIFLEKYRANIKGSSHWSQTIK